MDDGSDGLDVDPVCVGELSLERPGSVAIDQFLLLLSRQADLLLECPAGGIGDKTPSDLQVLVPQEPLDLDGRVRKASTQGHSNGGLGRSRVIEKPA